MVATDTDIDETLRAVSQAEFARRLGLHEDTVRDHIRRGDIKAGRIGRRVLIPVSELRRLLYGITPDAAAVEAVA